MDPFSSGEELVIKTRKPYTITKQRERWTEEEHNRFLEALKLYGRAWQRIEEHIGTKTAVQIRSHAQKFFTKLEKEALSKGVPTGQTLDIEIPPPRPKRKPSNPYPRKTSVGGPIPQLGGKEGKLSATVSALCHEKHILDLEKEPLPEKSSGGRMLENFNEGQNHNAEVFNLLQAAPCTSQLPNKNSMMNSLKPGNSCTFREFIPSLKESINKDEASKSIATVDDDGGHQKLKSDGKQSFHDNGACKISKFGNEKLPQDKRTYKGNQSENLDSLPTNDVQATQDYPRHTPIHIPDGSLTMSAANITSDMSYQESIFHHMGGVHGHVNLFGYQTSSTTSEHQSDEPRSSAHHSFPCFHPFFTPIQNQDDCWAFLHASSTFSRLIVSALLQNPAAHAAASFAATFWPCANLEAPADSNAGAAEGFPSPQINATPNVAAIAAATVAAATAWWAAHGLLPLRAPFHTAFTCSPASASTTPMDTGQDRPVNSGKREATPDIALEDQQMDLECSEALQEQHSASKSPCLSTSDSKESEGAKLNTGVIAAGAEQAGAVTELHDTNKLKSRKLVDRSSCGSNTPSSSEVEADGLEKHEKGKEESKEHDVIRPSSDSSNRRGRSFSNTNDSWKEVSEEGRMAFQALFSREVLPQSFSTPQDLKNNGKNIAEDKQNAESNVDVLQSDLSGKTCGTCSSNQLVEDNASLKGENSKEEGLPILGLEHAKLQARQSGFKPYKRCSVEANERRIAGTSSSQDEGKGAKRIRVEGEAST